MSPDDELLKLWARVERELQAASALVVIDPATRRLFDDFLAHNELGLAFQALVRALVDSPATPPSDARTHLEAAAAEMELQDDPDWRRLTERA